MDNYTLSAKSFGNFCLKYAPFFILVIFIALFLSTFQELYERWIKWDESLSHGLLVNGIFVFLIYKTLPWNRESNKKILQLAILILLASSSLIWLIAKLTNISIIEQSSLIIMFALLCAACFGMRTAYNLRLLLILPFFTIPIWDQLIDSLVNLSGYVVGLWVQLSNIPAIIEGNSIMIPYGHIVIADGCSGLRYLEIALSLGFIISLLNNYNEKQLLPTLIIAGIMGLVANWLRIFILVLVGYFSKMQSSLMSNHEYFGWALFAILCLPAIYFAPVHKAELKKSLTAKKPILLIPLLALSIGPLFNIIINADPHPHKLTNLVTQTSDIIGSAKLPVTVTAPDTPQSEQIELLDGANFIYVEIDQYQRNTAKDKLVPYISRLYNNEVWLANTYNLSNSDLSAIVFKLKTSEQHYIAQIQWFEIGDRITNSLRKAKLLQIPALIKSENDFRIVTLQMSCENSNCDAAFDRLSHLAGRFTRLHPPQ